MRTTGQLFRWGLTCLLLAPVAVMGAFTMGSTPPFLWVALLLVLLGGALNAAALVRGVRRVGSGDFMTSLDGMTPADRADRTGGRGSGSWGTGTAGSGAGGSGAGGSGAGGSAPAEPIVPRQRLIFPDDGLVPPPDRGLRRRVGLGAAAALLGLIAFGAYTLAVEQPLAIAQGLLTLDEVYAAWNTASRVGFTISLTIWVLLSLAVVLGVAVLALLPAIAADRILTPRRMLAAACIAGSVIVVAAVFPYFTLGISLPDDLPFAAGGVSSPGSQLFGLTGVALSATAILLTVPGWRRLPR